MEAAGFSERDHSTRRSIPAHWAFWKETVPRCISLIFHFIGVECYGPLIVRISRFIIRPESEGAMEDVTTKFLRVTTVTLPGLGFELDTFRKGVCHVAAGLLAWLFGTIHICEGLGYAMAR